MHFAARFCCALFLSAFVLSPLRGHAQYHSTPVSVENLTQPEYANTGLLVSDFATGSGAVVKHPNVALSCAHVVFNEYNFFNPWLSDNLWFNHWHAGSFPSIGSGKKLRGYLYFSNYSTNAFALGLADLRTFTLDFVAHYSYEPLADGRYSNAWDDGETAIKSGNLKMISGYPAGLYPIGNANSFLMHQTGPFYNSFQKVFDRYFELYGSSTGPGNSGGPLWVYQGAEALYAGVLIAGLEKSTGGQADIVGVRAVDKKSWELVDQAIAKLAKDPNYLPSPVEIASSPRLTVYGNTGLIDNGDLAPSRTDHTFLGSTSSDGGWIKRSFVIRNEGALGLELGSQRPIRISGKDRSVFRISKMPRGPIPSLKSAEFSVRFHSKRKGKFRSLITITSNDPERAEYSFMVAASRH